MTAGVLRGLVWAGVAAGCALILARAPQVRFSQLVPGRLGLQPVAVASAEVGAGERGFRTRAFSGFRTEAEREWGKANGLTAALAFSHNLGGVFPPELHATNPELFPLVAGKRIQPPKGSYFWNPDIAREDAAVHAARAAGEHFRAAPQAVSFPLGINDALIWGESPELLALTTPVTWFRERPDYTRLTYTFMNRVAAALETENPHVYVGALAYYWAEAPIEFQLHPQVMPFLTADRSQGYDPAFWQEELGVQQGWAKAAPQLPGKLPRRLGIYDYVYGSGFLVPRIHTKLIAEHLRHAKDAGFTDYYAEVYPNWGLDPVMPWLLAQLVRDPTASRPALLDTFFSRYFGEAAAPMRRFYERCEEIWMQQPGPSYWLKHFRNESQIRLFPTAVCAELRAQLEAARQLASSPRTRARVRLVSETFGVTERFAAFAAAREQLTRELVAGNPGGFDVAAEPLLRNVGRYLESRAEFERYTQALMKREPLALHGPINWNDFLRNDPASGALLALRERLGWPGAGAVDAAVAADAALRSLWAALKCAKPGPGRELLLNGAGAGPYSSPETIATLTYGLPNPRGWISRVEPSQHHEATWRTEGDRVLLRLSGTKDTSLFQWVQMKEAGVHIASLQLRGKVQPGTRVRLFLSWLDGAHKNIRAECVNLPEGEWPEWARLRVASLPPANAAWVGMGLVVQNQVRGDWIEATGFSLVADTTSGLTP